MPSIIDSLIITLGLDASNFEKGQKEAAVSFKKTREEAEGFGKGIEKSGKTAAEAIEGVGRQALILFGILAGAKSIQDFVGHISSADAALGRLARSMDTSPGKFAAITMAVERHGYSAEAAASSMKKLNDKFEDLKANGKQDEEISKLGAYGGYIDQNHGLKVAMPQLAARLHEMERRKGHSAAMAAAERAGFDPGTADFLTKGESNFNKEIKESEKLGVPTESSIGAATKLQEAYVRLRQVLDDIARQIATAMGPKAKEFLDWLTDCAKATDDWVKKNLPGYLESIQKHIEGFTLNPVVKNFAMAATDQAVLLKDLILGNDDAIAKDFQKTANAMITYWRSVVTYVGGNDLKDAFGGVLKWFRGQADEIYYTIFGKHMPDADGSGGSAPDEGMRIPGGGGTGLRGHRPAGGGGSGNELIRNRSRHHGGGRYHDTTNYTGTNAEALKQAAAQLGTTPHDLAMVMSYETAGTFSPSIHGGKGNQYQGLIQFGPAARSETGANDRQSFKEQLPAVVSYLKSHGYKPGMSLADLYSTINAGRPGRYGASDGNGTVSSHVEKMQREHETNVQRFLNSTSTDAGDADYRNHRGGKVPMPAHMADIFRRRHMTHKTSSAHHETNIGTVNVHTAATDATGIAKSIKPALERHAFAMQHNYGPA